MKKLCRLVFLATALSVLFGTASIALAQGEIAGGYSEAPPTDPEVVAAARFAVRQGSRKQGSTISLVSIDRVEIQVVAGLNYRLALRVKVSGKTRNAAAVVYQNLKRQYSLTSWTLESPATADTAAATTIEQLVASLAEAYTSKALGKLDADRPYIGRVRVVIEHSLAEDNAPDRFEVGSFKTLAKAEEWLQKRERGDEGPSRDTRPLKRCAKGVCSYDFDGGISHNSVYLKKVTYGIRRGRPYLKTIYLLDGD